MRQFTGVWSGGRGVRFGALVSGYALILGMTLWLSYQLRFDFALPEELQEGLALTFLWIISLKVAVLIAFGQFEDSLSYFSTPDLKRILGVCLFSSALIALVHRQGGLSVAPPRGVILIDLAFSCGTLCASRMLLRAIRERFLSPPTAAPKDRRVAIIGAGDTGSALVRELLAKRWTGLRPVGFFDDFCTMPTRLHGIPVWGPPEALLERALGARLDEAIIALPSAPAARIREIIKILQQAGLPFRTIPSMVQLATGTVRVSSLRPVQIEDLLGRDVVQIDTANVREMLQGRTVLVTGAGGSIGSELCRQIATCAPASVLLVERSEAALFPVEQELIERGHGGLVVPLVADIMDRARMEAIFRRYQPQAVFHAAAHKHVPMMEGQPAEAIRNNVFGTAQMAELACHHQAERFLLISTDKAINPTNVMGATKRIAETFVQAMQTRCDTRTKFMAVRFGNVLGSSGSVVPTFTRQIAAGGPVKVTHPEVTRYFMTIPEAVSLVLQSGARADGGEIFILDMGQPVKILDLARQMIELSGLRPDLDVEIEFTGLRPGEKLYEELSHKGEHVTPTSHPKILRLVCSPQPYDVVRPVLKDLAAALHHAPPSDLKRLLKQIVPEYTPDLREVEPQMEPAAAFDGASPVPAPPGEAIPRPFH